MDFTTRPGLATRQEAPPVATRNNNNPGRVVGCLSHSMSAFRLGVARLASL